MEMIVVAALAQAVALNIGENMSFVMQTRYNKSSFIKSVEYIRNILDVYTFKAKVLSLLLPSPPPQQQMLLLFIFVSFFPSLSLHHSDARFVRMGALVAWCCCKWRYTTKKMLKVILIEQLKTIYDTVLIVYVNTIMKLSITWKSKKKTIRTSFPIDSII